MYKKRHRGRRIFCKTTTSKALSGLVCADLLHVDDDNTKNLRAAVRHVSRSSLVSLPTGGRELRADVRVYVEAAVRRQERWR